jgi:hypothetical protein
MLFIEGKTHRPAAMNWRRHRARIRSVIRRTCRCLPGANEERHAHALVHCPSPRAAPFSAAALWSAIVAEENTSVCNCSLSARAPYVANRVVDRLHAPGTCGERRFRGQRASRSAVGLVVCVCIEGDIE